jgi:hypothetical protein
MMVGKDQIKRLHTAFCAHKRRVWYWEEQV